MAGQYESGLEHTSGWTTGDWNADGEFDSRDLVFAFSSGGYDSGHRPRPVPEPCHLLGHFFIVTLIFTRRRILQAVPSFYYTTPPALLSRPI